MQATVRLERDLVLFSRSAAAQPMRKVSILKSGRARKEKPAVCPIPNTTSMRPDENPRRNPQRHLYPPAPGNPEDGGPHQIELFFQGKGPKVAGLPPRAHEISQVQRGRQVSANGRARDQFCPIEQNDSSKK